MMAGAFHALRASSRPARALLDQKGRRLSVHPQGVAETIWEGAASKLTGLRVRPTMVSTGMRTAFRPLVVLSLVIAMTGAALAECVTEDLTPEQKACCAAMNHNCGAAGAEMGCCPTEPQTQDRVQASGVKPDLVAPVLLAGPLAILPEPHVRLHAVAAASYDRETLKLPDRPAYLLLSVFLI